MTKHKREFILLKTEEGTAKDEEDLEEVWQKRLDKVAPHYEIVAVEQHEIEGE